MLVRQLIGPYAGQVVEMPFHVAESCKQAGTACDPDDHDAVRRVRGLEIVPPEVVAEPVVEVPDTVVDFKKPKAKKLRKK